MMISQVDGNGNFKVTDITSDNVTATNGTFTNLNTTTFSPTNFNANTAVATNLTATNGTIDTLTNTTITSTGLATSGSINTGAITSGTITASGLINTTAGIIASGTISASTLNSTGNIVAGGNIVVPHVIIPSNNNLSSNAELIKLQDELRIKSGAGSTLGFYQGTTKHMELDANGNLISNSANIATINTGDFNIENSGFMKFYNTTGKYFAISHQPGGFVDFYGARNNPTTPNSFRFYSGDGLSNDLKMTIHGNSNMIEVQTIHAHGNIRTDELLLKDTTSVNTSRIIREQNTISFVGDTLYNSCDYEFYTADPAHTGATYPKLKINRTSDLVEIPELESTHITGTTIDATDVITTNLSASNTTTLNSTVTNLLLRNSNNDYSSIERTANVIKFIGDTTSTGSADYEFHTNDGNQVGGNVPKLRILRNNDLVQVINLNAIDTVEAVTLLGDQVSCVDGDFTNITTDDITVNDELDFGANDSKIWSGNASFHFQSGATLSGKDFKFQTGNIPAEVVWFKAGQGKGVIQTDEIQVTSAIVNGTNIETEIATKQDTLIAGTGITIVGNTISSTGGGSTLTAGTNIDITNNVVSTTANVEFTNSTTTGVLYVKDSTNVHEVLEYWNPAQSQFFKRSFVHDDYDMFDMLYFNNDATPANRSIDVACDITVTGDLVVNGTNVETQIATKQDTLTAGSGITIVGNTISTSAVTYTAGANMIINALDEIQTVLDPDFDQVDAGNTSIGGGGSAAVFHHKNLTNGFADWAITHYSNGKLILNSKTSQEILFRQNQVTKARIATNGDFEIMRQGTLSNLPTELDQIQGDLVTKQVNLTAGANITLDSFGNISSTNTTYTAGTGITIDANNNISSNAVTYTAGTNISINAQDEIETIIDPVFDQVDAGSTSIGGLGGAATVHHVSLTGFTDHALTQYSTGVTILNAKAGQQLSFRQGQVQKAKLDNAGDFHIMRSGTLSNLPTELDQIQGDLVTKQVNLTAGANIALDSFGNISSTDTTYTAGTGIAITGNVVSADSPLARISYYRLGGFTTIPNGTIRDYFQNSFNTEHNNLSIAFTAQSSSNASSGWLLPEGTFKIEYKCCFDNGTYNDRLGTRARFFFGAAYNLSADAHAYGRSSSFIDRQTLNSNFIYSVPAGGQYMRIYHNCSRNSVTYNDIWDSSAQIYGMTLAITKLD